MGHCEAVISLESQRCLLDLHLPVMLVSRNADASEGVDVNYNRTVLLRGVAVNVRQVS